MNEEPGFAGVRAGTGGMAAEEKAAATCLGFSEETWNASWLQSGPRAKHVLRGFASRV